MEDLDSYDLAEFVVGEILANGDITTREAIPNYTKYRVVWALCKVGFTYHPYADYQFTFGSVKFYSLESVLIHFDNDLNHRSI